MGVYIKGMEIPTYCNVCPMQRTDNTGELTFCALTRKVTRWWMYDRNESSEGHCPLIEIKPHGRLIDAEEEIKVWDACGIPGVFPHSRTTVSKFLLGHCIGKIPPTIIPSDKEEES